MDEIIRLLAAAEAAFERADEALKALPEFAEKMKQFRERLETARQALIERKTLFLTALISGISDQIEFRNPVAQMGWDVAELQLRSGSKSAAIRIRLKADREAQDYDLIALCRPECKSQYSDTCNLLSGHILLLVRDEQGYRDEVRLLIDGLIEQFQTEL